MNKDFAFLAPRHFCTRNTSHYPKPKIGNTKVHFSLSDSDSELEDDSNEKAEEVGNAAKLPPSYDPLNKNPVINELSTSLEEYRGSRHYCLAVKRHHFPFSRYFRLFPRLVGGSSCRISFSLFQLNEAFPPDVRPVLVIFWHYRITRPQKGEKELRRSSICLKSLPLCGSCYMEALTVGRSDSSEIPIFLLKYGPVISVIWSYHLLGMADLELILYFVTAFVCTVGSIALAIFHIYNHLLNYTEPIYQRYIVRIIFMVPVYALMSFLSLILPDSSIYFNSIREVYEAWVIYNFLSLCLAWVGGPGAVVLNLSGRSLKPSCCLMTCCLHPLSLDGRFIRRCKQGCLQFVILKPFLAAVTLILYANGKYYDGNFNPRQSYLYLTIIYTVSYSLALYALALFYVACKDLLHPFNPVPKFIIIKSVVFLTYWQVIFSEGMLIFLLEIH
ncbi:hypothetical protein SAY86_024026 [Trapa natans]|uniref:Uncharacterized protein n=1 Tax=Trapa natans TaxID=22666 RepID=A0AAN7RAT3_TRANT|nr:hypothetical protein SAY86_024026 [Trapa natans]